jgi:hypothetical protein
VQPLDVSCRRLVAGDWFVPDAPLLPREIGYVTDDTVERYAMKSLPESEAGTLEGHLLICQSCRERLLAEIEYVTAMRAAAAKIREAEKA